MRNDICYARLALAVLRQARRDLRDPRYHRSAALFLRSPAAEWWWQAYRELKTSNAPKVVALKVATEQ